MHQAMEAAGYAIAQAENSADRIIGRGARLVLGRLCAAAVLGAPVAWYIAGMHWNSVACAGLFAGIALYALLDAVRSAVRRARAGAKKSD